MTENESIMNYLFVNFCLFVRLCVTPLFILMVSQDVVVADNFAFEKLLKSRPPMTDNLNDIDSKQSGLDFGYVNYKTLLLFHPQMRTYNFKVNNFYRPVPKDLKVPLKFFLEDRERRSVSLIKRTKRDYDKHKRKLATLYETKSKVAADFVEQKRLLLRDKFANKEKELITLGDREKSALDNVSTQIEVTRERIKELYDRSFGIHYLRLDERQEAFSKIESGVRESIEIVRRKQHLVFVLNNQVGDLSKSFKLSSRMFEYPGFVEMNNLWKFLHRSKRLASGELDKIRLGDDTRSMIKFFNHQSNVGSIFQLPSINHFVLAGGKNITLRCLAEIYVKHEYPRDKIIRLINIIAELDKVNTK